jgi:hypothetical protein
MVMRDMASTRILGDLATCELIDLLASNARASKAASRALVNGSADLVHGALDTLTENFTVTRAVAGELCQRAQDAGHQVREDPGAVYAPFDMCDDRRLCKELANRTNRAHSAAASIATAIRVGMPNDVSKQVWTIRRASHRGERIARELAQRRHTSGS